MAMRVHQMVIFPLQGSGSGVYVDRLATSLARRGHTVNVLCCDHQPPQREYLVEAILFANGRNRDVDLDFNFPAFTSHPLSTTTTFGTLTKAQREAYVQVFHERIQQAIARFQPEIVHAHHGWVIAAALAAQPIPYIISLHGTEQYGFDHYPEYRELALRGLRGARLLIALTERDREQAIATYAVDPRKVVVVKSGVDTGVFKPMPVDRAALLGGYGVPSTRPVVLFAGKLTAIKGVDVLLRAAAIYERSSPSLVTLIAGDGDERARLEQLARELALQHVYFLGYQDQQALIALANIADVGVFPSRRDAFPLVPIELLACGTPIVASHVGGFPQIVADGVGVLVPPDDPVALAAQVEELIAGGFKIQARDQIVAHVRHNLSWDTTVVGIERVYEQALIGDRRSRVED
jgi:glycosyltransferase involved in cell wall biosynthesis